MIDNLERLLGQPLHDNIISLLSEHTAVIPARDQNDLSEMIAALSALDLALYSMQRSLSIEESTMLFGSFLRVAYWLGHMTGQAERERDDEKDTPPDRQSDEDWWTNTGAREDHD